MQLDQGGMERRESAFLLGMVEVEEPADHDEETHKSLPTQQSDDVPL
jgi:hypothetical protein